LQDVGALYCPSMAGAQWTFEYRRRGWEPGPAHDIRYWEKIGGRDGQALQYGDYTEAYFNPSTLTPEAAALSSYNYRGTPLGVWEPDWHRWEDGDSDWGHIVPGTKPAVKPRINQPIFRTPRELGARALVMDTFDKGITYDALGRNVLSLFGQPIEMSTTIAGYGLTHHKDGYNVLYGDNHVQWYGDPQQRIIWCRQGYSITCAGYGSYYTMSNSTIFGRGFRPWYGLDHYYFAYSPHALWHQIDVFGNVDVDAK